MTITLTRRRYNPSSHDGFTHDTLDAVAFDWSRVADPKVAPRWPLKVYLPATTEDVVQIVKDAAAIGESITLRGNGHSSNDLVTAPGGAVMMVTRMNKILDIDTEGRTVTVQGGVILFDVDVALAPHGLGLPIVGDHNHITAAGFASVGGISPASHRFGMFVDTVASLEYVDWAGEIHLCGPAEDPDRFYRVLAGTGQHGVITKLTVNLEVVDKFGTIVRNDLSLSLDLDRFLADSGRKIADPGGALMERGVWADLPMPGGGQLRLGQFSAYHETSQHPVKKILGRVTNGYLQSLGYVAGRLPPVVDDVVKVVGMAGIMLSPPYATIKEVERFTDQVLDSTAGDPTRMLVALAPVENYAALFRRMYDACVAERARSGAITFISVYVKALRSPYLSRGVDGRRHCEVMVYFGVNPGKMTEDILDSLVTEVDTAVIEFEAFRYMHSRTVTDPVRRELIDPNAAYSEKLPAGMPPRPRRAPRSKPTVVRT